MPRSSDNDALDPALAELRDRVALLERELAASDARRSASESAEQRYAMFLESVQDYAFITFDLAGLVVGWSRGAERILGYDEREALGLPTGAFFTPEDRARGEDMRELYTARDVGRAEDERWHMRRDGSRFWGSGVMTRLHDEAGTHRGYSKVMRDQTERRLAAERLRESEERFRLFTENVRDYALVPVDTAGLISGWNNGAARIFGYAAAEVLGQSAALLFCAEDAASGEPERDLHKAMVEGRAEDERWMVRKDGSRFWSRWVTTSMRNDAGEHVGFAKVLRDETERKQAQEERERLQERERLLLRTQVQETGEALDRTKDELRALASGLLHAQEEERRRIARDLHDDLSQRLAMLDSGLAKLRASLPEDLPHLRAELRQLEQNAGSLASEVRRLSHQLHPSILEDLGIAVALRRLAADFFQDRRTRPVEFVARDIPIAVPLRVGAVLYRITQEALRNVARHADPESVAISLVGEPGGLRLTISDSGPGFDPAAVRGRGGLGIISMHERARLVGGTLRVTSQPGAGTTLEVFVPLNGDGDDADGV